ncbi:putative peptidyl-tRNA hydrolase PTRHD1 [Nylanderia fulva]|uniref:putative peptidyl-tRNA hydrolase PTRHD1 n=1 Tax=Nylanderia fulva TaxID=613905 RepID=UPI0010FB1450|nr:putative peptidyl-tRNA hydrolase PTRHD1 [Nylanderia fulva]XP_029172800.1 putative peptidyl-tRNA hydrolase PTRHD1 [Nylanderia fulva]XP_029172801.1 putative peptidyl-tRNA hydrolase PTRHD1 [Nylanderia fulva]
MSEVIVQYVVLRGDLSRKLRWPLGAVIAQACHACTAVTHLFYNDVHTQAYLADLDSMHKVVLDAADEADLKTLSSELKAADIQHKLWIEQPENTATCLVTKPYPKNKVQSYFAKYKLLKL